MLSLAYLAAYHLIGYPRILSWMGWWLAVVAVVESARLAAPRINALLLGFFPGLARPEEHARFSGIFYTTLGALIVMAGFGRRPDIVSASLLCLALGDAAAALVGKAIGRRRIGGKKSLEGSLACLAVCAAVGLAQGFPAPACLAMALAATAMELMPTGVVFNDNLWMPVAAALALGLFLP